MIVILREKLTTMNCMYIKSILSDKGEIGSSATLYSFKCHSIGGTAVGDENTHSNDHRELEIHSKLMYNYRTTQLGKLPVGKTKEDTHSDEHGKWKNRCTIRVHYLLQFKFTFLFTRALCSTPNWHSR